MRILSLVPSWTETLIAAGANVVGRTRYCIHPSSVVQSIPIVGGTKSIYKEKIQELKPDLIIFDKEENTLEMSQDLSDFKQWHSHIRSIENMPATLSDLSQNLNSSELLRMSNDWQKLLKLRPKNFSIEAIPGLQSWIREPSKDITQLLYLIWYDPWMGVSKQTFIGSVLDWVGAAPLLPDFDENYPKLDLENYNSNNTLLLASSEPFPFKNKPEVFQELNNPVAIVDGELYSWFGIRSYQGLYAILENQTDAQ